MFTRNGPSFGLISFKTYLLRTESLYVNEEINNDPQDLEAGLNGFAMRGIRLDNPL